MSRRAPYNTLAKERRLIAELKQPARVARRGVETRGRGFPDPDFMDQHRRLYRLHQAGPAPAEPSDVVTADVKMRKNQPGMLATAGTPLVLQPLFTPPPPYTSASRFRVDLAYVGNTPPRSRLAAVQLRGVPRDLAHFRVTHRDTGTAT